LGKAWRAQLFGQELIPFSEWLSAWDEEEEVLTLPETVLAPDI
jgi:hypothetical protein